MSNHLRIDYDLNNIDIILKSNIYSKRFVVGIHFEKNTNDNTKLKKHRKENILKLKEKLESINKFYNLKFIDFCIYKEITFLCENLKPNILFFDNCRLEEGTKKEMLKLLNNCVFVTVNKKIEKILFYVLKNYFSKVNGKSLTLKRLEYKSMKNIFFGMYLNRLELTKLKTTEREMRKVLKSLHGTVNLRNYTHDNKKAHGLIYNRIEIFKSNNKKENESIFGNRSLHLKFKVGKANEIFLNSLPNWINEVEIESNYKEEDFKYLLTNFYKGGTPIKIFGEVKYFGNLTNETEIGLLEYVNKIK